MICRGFAHVDAEVKRLTPESLNLKNYLRCLRILRDKVVSDEPAYHSQPGRVEAD